MHIYRASELGGCIKRNVAGRLGVKPKEAPASVTQMFERGNAHEEACVAVMKDQGWTIIMQQKELVLPINDDCCVMGHVDGMVTPPDSNSLFVGEIKSPTSWQMFLDNQYNPDPPFLVSRYLWQLSVYMVCSEREALLITLDDYKVKYHGIELPPYTKEQIRQRVLDIEHQAGQGLPQYCNVREYPCPYYFLHEDEIGDDEDPFDFRLHDVATRYRLSSREANRAKKELDELMRDREHYHNADVRITKTKATRRNTDYKRMAVENGIALGEYQSTSTYYTTRVTIAGVEDGED